MLLSLKIRRLIREALADLQVFLSSSVRQWLATESTRAAILIKQTKQKNLQTNTPPQTNKQKTPRPPKLLSSLLKQTKDFLQEIVRVAL